MKKFLLLTAILLIGFSLVACASSVKNNTFLIKQSNQLASNPAEATRIKMKINNQEVIVRLYDNPTSQDLLTMLPLTLTFRDYKDHVDDEKISYLPRKLNTQGAGNGDNRRDDFTYFSPWGNLAIFHKGKQQGGNGLIILGTIESGKEILAEQTSDFTAILERID